MAHSASARDQWSIARLLARPSYESKPTDYEAFDGIWTWFLSCRRRGRTRHRALRPALLRAASCRRTLSHNICAFKVDISDGWVIHFIHAVEDFLRMCQNLVGVPGALGSRDRRVGAPAEVLWDTPTTMDRFRRATYTHVRVAKSLIGEIFFLARQAWRWLQMGCPTSDTPGQGLNLAVSCASCPCGQG